jgi:hypothetical protein
MIRTYGLNIRLYRGVFRNRVCLSERGYVMFRNQIDDAEKNAFWCSGLLGQPERQQRTGQSQILFCLFDTAQYFHRTA